MACDLAVIYCRFFFFKQKTAYEMRISDWSSDVCSSDLSTSPLELPVKLADLKSRLTLALIFQMRPLSDEDKLRALQLRASRRGLHQIGRASGRERVCQYV